MAANPRKYRRLTVALMLAAALALLAYNLRPAPARPIRIGVLHSLSGTMAVSEAPLVDAIRLAVEEINRGGGLLGRPVEMVIADGRSDWNVFAAEAERLIVEERVSALFACWTSACRKAVKPVVERHNHLLFYPVQYEGLEMSPNIVYTGSAPNQQIIPGTRWALDHFGERVYLIGSAYLFPRAANRIVRDLVTASGGRIVGERYVPLGTAPEASIIEALRRETPDVIVNTLNGDSNLHFFRAIRGARLEHIPVLSFSVAEAELQALGTESFHPGHFVAWSYFQSIPSEANRRFVASFRTRFGAGRVTSDPIEAAYNSVLLWAKAVAEAGAEAPEHVNLAIGNQSIPGPSGVVAVDAGTRHLWKWIRIGKANRDGQFEQIEVSEAAVRPEPFPAYRSIEAWQKIVADVESVPEAQP